MLSQQEDPRLQPGAYVTDCGGLRLYEVVLVDGATVELQNCATECRLRTVRTAMHTYRLVRRAPTAPDYPDPDQEVT